MDWRSELSAEEQAYLATAAPRSKVREIAEWRGWTISEDKDGWWLVVDRVPFGPAGWQRLEDEVLLRHYHSRHVV
jgi:hypothetical protein